VIVAKLNALGVMFATGDVPQNVNFAVAIGAVRQFLQNKNIQVTEEDSTTELPLPEIAKKAKLSTYLIECGTRDDAIALRSTLEPAPVSPSFRDAPRLQPIPVDLSKLKFSDIRRPYPELYPQVFEFSVSNAGSDPVSELTIAFRRIQGQPCSRNLQEYDGFKKFSVNLPSGDSVTVRDEFSAQAVSFCIVRAVGPPVGLAACSNPKLAADVGITACTSVIQSGELPAASLAAAYLGRGDRYENVGEYEKAIADYTQVVRLGAQSPDAFSQVSWDVFTHRGWAYAKINDYDRAIRDSNEAIRLNPRSEKSLFVRAYSSIRKGDYDRAISDFTEMIRLDAKSGIAFSGRALLYYQKGERQLFRWATRVA
jgi:lipoprotein NlpI